VHQLPGNFSPDSPWEIPVLLHGIACQRRRQAVPGICEVGHLAGGRYPASQYGCWIEAPGRLGLGPPLTGEIRTQIKELTPGGDI